MSSASDSHRLAILTSEEIDDLYGLPRFSDDDRQLYFELSPAELAAIEARTTSVGVALALELGYFKAKRQFFNFEPAEVIDDLRYLLATYFPGRPVESIKPPSKPTRINVIQRTILELVGYSYCDATAQQALEDKARRIAMLSTQPLYILRESLQHLANDRVVAPRYTTLQDMVGRVVTHEGNRVAALLAASMTPEVEKALDVLLQADEQTYRISALKHEPRDFSHKELKREVERRQFFQPLHDFARTFLVEAGLSNESGKYYASLVKFYTVYKLQRMPKGSARLYLLCFAFHRFRQINDNLIEAFIHLVDNYEKQAKLAAEAAMQQALLDAADRLQAAGEVLRLLGVCRDTGKNDTHASRRDVGALPEVAQTRRYLSGWQSFLRRQGVAAKTPWGNISKATALATGYLGSTLARNAEHIPQELIRHGWPTVVTGHARFVGSVAAKQALHTLQTGRRGNCFARRLMAQHRDWLVCPIRVLLSHHLLQQRRHCLRLKLWGRTTAAGAAFACGRAAWIGHLSGQVSHRSASDRLEPGAALVGKALRAIEDLDAVGRFAGVDRCQAALHAATGVAFAMPALFRISAHIRLREEHTGKCSRVIDAVVIGDEQDRLARGRVAQVWRGEGLDPLREPTLGNRQLGQLKVVRGVQARVQRGPDPLYDVGLAQRRESIDRPRQLEVIGQVHHARAHQHARPGGLATAAFLHKERLGHRVELVH